MIDNESPYRFIFKHYLGKLTAAYSGRWPAQRLKRNTNYLLFYFILGGKPEHCLKTSKKDLDMLSCRLPYLIVEDFGSKT